MEWITKGVEQFQSNVFPGEQLLFESLAKQQNPQVLFITCADSRICPNLITQARPGQIFHLRNAGNIVPAYGTGHGAEAATIEYAVSALGIPNIIVCGHSDCGAMKGLLHPEAVKSMPAVGQWLQQCEAARRVAVQGGGPEHDQLHRLIEQNVLAQLLNLQTHPSVAARLASGQTHLFGWVYEIGTGSILSYRPESRRFEPMCQDLNAVPGLFSCADFGSLAAGAD
jgi:carbonic anhydrase